VLIQPPIMPASFSEQAQPPLSRQRRLFPRIRKKACIPSPTIEVSTRHQVLSIVIISVYIPERQCRNPSSPLSRMMPSHHHENVSALEKPVFPAGNAKENATSNSHVPHAQHTAINANTPQTMDPLHHSSTSHMHLTCHRIRRPLRVRTQSHEQSSQNRRPERDETPESPESAVDQGILDPVKTRYMGLHSVMAFPRNLGLEFQSANPPRVHSFAWNCGIRPEENGSSHINLKDLISREESNGYLKVYFETVHPVFGILDQEIFSRTADQFWSEATGHSAFEAILAGVIALGSFFSATLGHPRELEIVQHAKSILEDPVISRRVSIDQVSAWVLRTLYLRSTTRPHMAWLASNIAMHLAEATGLHHETDAVVLTTTDPSSQFVPNESGREQARRLFWSAWMANSMISYEYGRSSTSLNNITCKQPSLIKGDYTSLLISLGQLIPRESLDGGPDLQHTLPKIQQIPDDHPFISTSKADLTMSLYRHHRLLKQPIEQEGDFADHQHRQYRYTKQHTSLHKKTSSGGTSSAPSSNTCASSWRSIP
jgi:hypothetical protein